MKTRCSTLAIVTVALAAAFTSNLAYAGERRFTYVQEATTTPKGMLELENWVTWKNHEGAYQTDYDNLDFRHEIEYGLTDRLQISGYFDWSILDDNQRDHHVRFKDVAFEAKLNLTNPVTDFVGSALYGEVKVGDRLLKLEGKVILQKNFGPWLIAYNAIVEAEFEGSHLDEETGEFAQTLGVSYQINPYLTIGAEMLHEIEFPDWTYSARGDNAFYAGPNVSVRYGNWFATVTPLVQLSSIEGEPDVQTRMIFGVSF